MNTPGYAVIDVETTGIQPGFHHRIAEIAIVHVDPSGAVTDSWDTLVNPGRDLGPQWIHGIRAADVRRAPVFGEVAGEIAARLAGRVVVAHNWAFDAMHLRAEYQRLGHEVPLHRDAGLCTMRATGVAIPWTRRSLVECCAAAGLPERDWHTAAADAAAAADLLRFLLAAAPDVVRLSEEQLRTAAWRWPDLGDHRGRAVQRTPSGTTRPHFLARLVDRIPRAERPETDAYLAMLDRALLDRHLSDTEADGLLDLAHDLGLHKAEVVEVHHSYLTALAQAAWDDGVVTPDEHADLVSVTGLLDLDEDAVDVALRAALDEPMTPTSVSVGGLHLAPGDTVVLTGTMRRGRREITADAVAVGLRMTTNVSRRTTVVVAADPDSLSGKAERARELGVPVVTEDAFLSLLDSVRHG
ncbi:exonuclease domain-containing protein [Pseudonocardia oroxyli]|uniref:DNA polymerase-3 subunit epsilon n=1 Tax=Pseudonocardia oroxyli TaxID=366584 RepID=A0A1G7ZS76_PSEOR|nr:exonuclease domain-containing protein [Pseudonocardia oroxyli]SDH11534.1 DNA polymerase-3 subunit epsilon [Pseudonocardia oroxyli]